MILAVMLLVGELSGLGYALFFIGILLAFAVGLVIGMALKARKMAASEDSVSGPIPVKSDPQGTGQTQVQPDAGVAQDGTVATGATQSAEGTTTQEGAGISGADGTVPIDPAAQTQDGDQAPVTDGAIPMNPDGTQAPPADGSQAPLDGAALPPEGATNDAVSSVAQPTPDGAPGGSEPAPGDVPAPDNGPETSPPCPECSQPLEKGWTDCLRCKTKALQTKMDENNAYIKENKLKSKKLDEMMAEYTSLPETPFEPRVEKANAIISQQAEIMDISKNLASQLESAKSTIASVEGEGKDVTSSKNTLYLATSFKDQGNIEKAYRYAVKAERLAKEIGGVTQVKVPEPPPSDSPVPESTQEIHHRAIICHACKGVIKPGLPITKCACNRMYHENCATRVMDCPACGKKL